MTTKKPFALLTTLVLAIHVTACDPLPTERRDLAPIEITTTRPDAAMPYGPGFEHLANKGPETVATAAMEHLCTFTAAEYDAMTVHERLQGITTPKAWRAVTADPSTITPHMILRSWDTWDRAGGTQRAEVTISNEIHPEDSDTTWHRKMACTRIMDGFDEIFIDDFVVILEKNRGQWRIDHLSLLSSVFT
ncbi:hypothetical protein [Corynebacterium mayonis]|uniref:hypothetical protein n=1 Tax=Corynebacterium mayonis TaxID=3062461 RepID=UPI003140412B